ncbi:hypothetical protein Sjap_017267 [Stephania japonica]|uniref:F-box domain-containing protein n=1 Tax=Stephania japonica TaxID=461633 RepID=A0AAP0NI42_9MAGN
MKKRKLIVRGFAGMEERTIGDDEIIFQEILPRLPAKSLCRFKLVCKKWLNLLTHDPLFLAHHSQKAPNTTNISSFLALREGLFFSSDGQCSRFRWPKEVVMGSTNGLVYGMQYDDYNRFSRIFICNPITNHAVHVPNPTGHMSLLALAWDQYNATFGFTLVQPVFLYNEGVYQFQVYSSKKGEWRVSKNASAFRAPWSCRYFNMRSAVYVRGKVYWYVMHDILWFDIEKDVAGILERPYKITRSVLDFPFHYLMFKDTTFSKIGECDGKLSYVTMTRRRVLEIWLLMEKNNELEWVKKQVVGLQEVFEQNWEVMSRTCKYGQNIDKDKEVAALWRHVRPLPYFGGEFILFLARATSKVFSFNLTTQELKLINKNTMISPPLYPFKPTILPCPA